MPQLDSLRAFAFFAVACSHWLAARTPLANLGGPGVQLFFALSGFLITGILLDYRRAHESNETLSAGSALRTFYARRFLRIFPLFYAVIAVASMMDLGPIRELWPWHVSYASNFLYAIHAPGKGDPFSHFWTLGVEEQFYLVWPFLVLFLPLVTLKRLMLVLIVAAPLFRIAIHLAFPELYRVNYLPLSCGDSLGVGAYLAFASRYESFFSFPASTLARRMGVLGVVGGLAAGALILVLGESFALVTIAHTLLVLVFGWLVFAAAHGFGGPLGRLLNRRDLRFLGKISYGLYVFHHFFTRVDFGRVFQRLGIPSAWADYILVQLFCRFAVTFVLAVVSWYLLEQPLNNLKRHFTIAKKLAAARAVQKLEVMPSGAEKA